MQFKTYSEGQFNQQNISPNNIFQKNTFKNEQKLKKSESENSKDDNDFLNDILAEDDDDSSDE